jgi:hypothetical protein
VIILVKFASRGRPQRFFEGLDCLYQQCAKPELMRVLITADIDDRSMCNQEVRNRIATYPNAHVIYGTSENKIHATNRDMDIMPHDWEDWDIIANYSDDQRFTIYGWDEMIRSDFRTHSPDLSHFMAYLDPDTKGALSTLYIAGRKFYDRFGFIYDPQFVSLFADNLVEDSAKKIGKFHYTNYSIYQHFNPSYYHHLEKDEMFLEQQKIGWDVDQKTYYKIISEIGLD